MNHFQPIQIKCPQCFESRFWKTSDGRLKCKKCRYLFKLKPNSLNISNQILNEVITEFLLEHSTNIILQRVKISKYRLLKILTLLRTLMAKDIPDVFQKITKLDDDYFDNQIEKKSLEVLKSKNNPKQPIIGILCKEKSVYAKILPNIESEDLKFLLEKKEAINHFEDWQKNFGLVFKSSLYRLIPLKYKEYQIDVLDGFWGYLKRKFSAKGGIRKEKLPLYLGEYVWRYNHRRLTLKEQEKLLLNLVFQCDISKN